MIRTWEPRISASALFRMVTGSWVLSGMKAEDVELEKIVAFPVPPVSELLSQDECARPVIMSLVVRTGTVLCF